MKYLQFSYFFSLLLVVPNSCKTDEKTVLRSDTELKLLSVIWHQNAAECRALCYQAFNIARLRLDAVLAEEKQEGSKPKAIVTDIDETIVDNSYSYAKPLKLNKKPFKANWPEWIAKSKATALPGAVEFLQYARKQGVEIFYISNRDTVAVDATLKNLENLDFPDVEKDHMLFRSDDSSKELRRQLVADRYNIVLFLGDNLNDFLSDFEGKKIDSRSYIADQAKMDFGKKFIVLPNVMYGEWFNGIYGYKKKLTLEQKDSIRLSLLKAY